MILAAALMFAALLATLLLPSEDTHHDPLEIHHGYLGVVLVGLAALAGVPDWVAWVGLVLWFDDMVQHFVQVWDPGYRSPVHCLWYFRRFTCRGK